ncbi:MAG: hypothetical protein L6427_12895, partial [Actinomycetia bacterium]|nr:hypothetical protein [Actinomycetes bacterium]
MGTITAGNDQSGTSDGGTGLRFDMDFASGCNTGNITSNGMVDLRANVISRIQTGSITAGSSLTTASPNNTGVIWRGSNLSSITTGGGAVTGRGDIIATMASGSHITTGDIWSGGKVELDGKEWLTLNDTITTGSISAKGNVHVTSGDTLTVNGSITSESWVRVYLAFLVEGTGWDDIRITGSVSAGSATIPSGSGAGKSIYINNNVDFPGPDEVVIIGDSIKAVGPITILGNDTVQTGNIESNSNVDVSWSLGYWGSSNRYYLGYIYAGGYVDIYTDAELTGVDDSINTGAVRAEATPG